MQHVIFFVVIFFTALMWALLEIQVEGKNGWAAALPTWRYKIYVKYIWDREITGYHVYLMGFIMLLLHSAFLYVPWSMVLELKIFAFFLIMAVTEDFLWFIFNPSFGFSKFTRSFVPWHTMWFLRVPTFYWVILPLGLFLYAISLTL